MVDNLENREKMLEQAFDELKALRRVNDHLAQIGFVKSEFLLKEIAEIEKKLISLKNSVRRCV